MRRYFIFVKVVSLLHVQKIAVLIKIALVLLLSKERSLSTTTSIMSREEVQRELESQIKQVVIMSWHEIVFSWCNTARDMDERRR